MPKLTAVIQDTITIFHNYSKKECSNHKLNKEELNQLIQNEFSDVIKNPKDPQTIATLIKILDENNDGEVDFDEFCDLLCKVFKTYYKVVYQSEDSCEKQPQGSGKNEGSTTQTAEVKSTTQEENKPDSTKYYQKPIFPKYDQEVLHEPKEFSQEIDNKPVRSGYDTASDANLKCADVPTGQVSTQTEPNKTAPVEHKSEEYHEPKDNLYGVEQKSAPINTNNKSTPTKYEQTTSTVTKEEPQKSDCSSKKEEHKEQYEQKSSENKDKKYEVTQSEKTTTQTPSNQEKKDQTYQPGKITILPLADHETDHTSQAEHTTPKPTSGQEKKNETQHDKMAEVQLKYQTPQPYKPISSPPKENETSYQEHTTSQLPKEQEQPAKTIPQPSQQTPPDYQQPQKYYQQPVFPTPQEKTTESQIPEQPPKYSQCKEDPAQPQKPVVEQQPQKPVVEQQPQKPVVEQQPQQQSQQYKKVYKYDYQSH
ncbi:uncharacterized protein LOC128642747 [Bombina bombina]|uniref:uncharacterized protein LOC128642747 n=1 Tax=Bombina bombina TaxID=8345 RepID=UPI00235A6500|nr:uncharacterized protein LOC128642747 [Bombina bombina]